MFRVNETSSVIFSGAIEKYEEEFRDLPFAFCKVDGSSPGSTSFAFNKIK